jgi:hypothetical protein
MSAMGGSSAGLALHYPTLAFAFGLILIGSTIWDLDQLSVAWRAAPGLAPAMVRAAPRSAAAALHAPGTGVRQGAAVLLTPATTVACRIVMGATMALMLFLMI